ncbi:hypothetical protein [Natronomonas sp. EA1]|uniref:hypothetical protein n=1 Tax=Natronomonas sp. EA1 TaxID=3421655 RepID=UPI003EB7AD82
MPSTFPARSRDSPVGPAGHALCALSALALTALALFLGFTTVAAATAQLGLLASTALVLVFAFALVIWWLLFEIAAAEVAGRA